MKLMTLIDHANDEEKDEDEAEKAAQELDQFVTSPSWLRTTTLPVSILGSGNADLAAKSEALVHALKLDTSSAPRLYIWSQLRAQPNTYYIVHFLHHRGTVPPSLSRTPKFSQLLEIPCWDSVQIMGLSH